MKAQRLGIITSLVIHAGFMVLFISLPIANAIPYTKTLMISLTRQDASPSTDSKELRAPEQPITEEVRHINNTDFAEIKERLDEVIINEQPNTPFPQKAEIQAAAKTEITSLGKGETKTITETVFGNSGAPSFTHREMPAYPFLARRFGKEGTVVLKLLIDKNGYLQNIEVIEPSGFGFTEAAIDAIKKSRFAPAHRNGEKITSRALLSVHFNIK